MTARNQKDAEDDPIDWDDLAKESSDEDDDFGSDVDLD